MEVSNGTNLRAIIFNVFSPVQHTNILKENLMVIFNIFSLIAGRNLAEEKLVVVSANNKTNLEVIIFQDISADYRAKFGGVKASFFGGVYKGAYVVPFL